MKCFAGERDQEAIAKLHKEKEKLDKVIQQKKLEQKLLESQLNDVKCENMKQKEDMLKVKEDILHNFAELMEMELQCSICNELFVYVSDSLVFLSFQSGHFEVDARVHLEGNSSHESSRNTAQLSVCG